MDRRRHEARSLVLLVFLGLPILACGPDVEIVPQPFLPTSAHEAYGHALEQADLDTTALGRDWRQVADKTLEAPVDVSLPFRESGWFDAGRADAVGYRFSVEGGRRIDVEVEVEAEARSRLFVDLFRIPAEAGRPPVHVATAPALQPRLEFEPLRQADYVLRIQPELLRELRYTVVIRSDPQLGFPIAGLDTTAIQSAFGAPREAGRRRHHGVDIFAPRGTPVLAATDGVIRRVETTEVGGNVVWLRDDKLDYHLYYAHLDNHVPTLRRGQRVTEGEVLGYVGNTGNARTTPPHLHFGVYARGPVDPQSFLRRPQREPPAIRGDLAELGAWVRTRSPDTSVREAPSGSSASVAEVPSGTPLLVRGATDRWLRVELPSDRTGYVAGEYLEPAVRPLREMQVGVGTTILHRPRAGGLERERFGAGASLPVLGAWNGFLMVPTSGGRPGWVRESATRTEDAPSP